MITKKEVSCLVKAKSEIFGEIDRREIPGATPRLERERWFNARNTEKRVPFPIRSIASRPTLAVVALQGLIVQLLRANTILRVSILSRNILLKGPGLRIGIMPPKQATLGLEIQLSLRSATIMVCVLGG